MISYRQFALLPVTSIRLSFERLAERAALAAAAEAAEAGGIEHVRTRPFHHADVRNIGPRSLQGLSAAARVPLTAEECLEVLARGEALARYYRDEGRVHHAVVAGAGWDQIAEALGTSPGEARKAYREWAGKQVRIRWEHPRTGAGLSEEEYAAALRAAAEPGEGSR